MSENTETGSQALMPEHYAPSPAAQQVIAALSDGRITQPWRGHVALVEYDRDPDTGEWLWPCEMSERWQQRIREVAAAARAAGGRR